MPDATLMRKVLELKENKALFESRLKEINSEIKQIKEALVQEFLDEGIGSTSVNDEEGNRMGLLTLVTKTFPRMLDREAFLRYIDGSPDLHHLRTVNAMTLRSWYNKEADEDIKEHPENYGLAVYEESDIQLRK